MDVDPQSAMRGVRARLVGAVMAASVTLVCVLYAMLSSLGSFGATFALTMGICSFGAAVALLLSARHEEEVHELAFQFGKLPGAALTDASEDSSTETISAAEPRALPKPDPLEGFDRVEQASAERASAERLALQSVKRSDHSSHTDGAI